MSYLGEPPAIVQHVVSSNGIWDPNQLSNPPVITTTTGTGIGDYPSHWYQPVYPSVIEPVVVPFTQPEPFRINWPPLNPLPVVTVPNITMPNLTFPQMQELMRALQALPLSQKPAEEQKEEEAKPVEKKYGRVLEP